MADASGPVLLGPGPGPQAGPSLLRRTTRSPSTQALAVFLAARALSFAMLAAVRPRDDPAARGSSLLDHVAGKADGGWHEAIAATGYPGALPVDGAGEVQENAWAFLPLYPYLVRGVMTVTGLTWSFAAPLVALAAGAGAAVVIRALVARAAAALVADSPWLPLATVALLSVYPASPVLGAGYSESLALLVLASGLLALHGRRYGLAGAAVLALGLTRPVTLPFAAVVVLHAVVRRRAARRGEDTWDRGVAARLGALTAVAAVAGVLWQAVVGLVTGDPDAYLHTQAAWRGGRDVAPFAGWVHSWEVAPGAVTVVAVGAVVVALVLARPTSRRLGPELWGWAVAYPVYLAAVLELHTSMVRFGLLAIGLVPAVVLLVRRPRWAAVAWTLLLGAVLLAGQAVWLWWIWRAVQGDAFHPSP